MRVIFSFRFCLRDSFLQMVRAFSDLSFLLESYDIALSINIWHMPDRCTSGCQGSSDPWQNRDFSKCELWELMRELQGSISSQLEEFFQYPSNMILPLQMSNIWKNNFGSTAVTWLLDFLKCKFPIITCKCVFARGHLTPDNPRDIDQACVIY